MNNFLGTKGDWIKGVEIELFFMLNKVEVFKGTVSTFSSSIGNSIILRLSLVLLVSKSISLDGSNKFLRV